MAARRLAVFAVATVLGTAAPATLAAGQAPDPIQSESGGAPESVIPPESIHLVVDAGRPLRVALDHRMTVKQAGQLVSGTLVEDVYARDRIVAHAGQQVRGRIAALVDPSKTERFREVAGGSFGPNRQIVLEFDALMLDDGTEIPIRTVVGPVTERLTLRVAASDNDKESAKDDDDDHTGVTDRTRQEIANAKHEATQKARDAIAAIKGPDKMERLKAAAIDRLPYHPQYLTKGSVYSAALVEPVDFGMAAPVAPAPDGALPAPESVLNARLVTGLNSAKSLKGERVVAVISEPVFSADHRLILSEGAQLEGEVTFVRGARHLHKDGQLRFLFEKVVPADRDATTLRASLHSAQVDAASGIQIDEEGGTRAVSSKTRFIAPAVALLSLRSVLNRERRPFDGDGDDNTIQAAGSNVGARSVGSFFGWGLAGTAIGLISRQAGIALTVVGAARTVYSSVFGKGRDVTFAADTPIQVQLAPGPAVTP